MRALRFSPKQRRVLTWWRPSSPDSGYNALLCEGAVRSGKTLCTGLSFFCWAMTCFSGRSFALCGKSVPAVRRNVWQELRPILLGMGFHLRERRSLNQIDVYLGRRHNTVYLFGGLDERSAALVQGITLAGALLDEAALMPRSFVEQVCARCSVEGSRLWFSCNPDSPAHWFYQEWVQKAREKHMLRLSFTMRDNPGLSPATIRRYEAMFQGTFYRRFILGEWTAAEGLVYDFFGPELVRDVPEGLGGPWYISCDYGTVNPTSMGLWGRKNGVWYRAAEFYYDARKERRQKTDGEYAQDLDRLAGGRPIRGVVVDPSAASFSELLRRQGWSVIRADNEVLSGIRRTAELLRAGALVICSPCRDAIREFGLYRWDSSGTGGDRVIKTHDHAMDDIRYFAATVAAKKTRGFFAGNVERSAQESPWEGRNL